MTSKISIAVFGTPQLAADIFENLQSIANIKAVFCAEDKKVGRKQELQKPPVALWAQEKNIPLFQPKALTEEDAKILATQGVQVFVVVAYGKLFSEDFLHAFPDIWNLHFSLLPKYRGASPVQSALLAGEKESGISIFRIQKGLDDGPLLRQEICSLEEKRSEEAFSEMQKIGTAALQELLKKKQRGEEIPEQKQDESQASWCQKIQKSDGECFPEEETPEKILQKMRAFSLWPQTFFLYEGKRIKILNGEKSQETIPSGKLQSREKQLFLGCQTGSLLLKSVQKEGKKQVSGEEFVRGFL